MADDVNFVMGKRSSERQALETTWIERCKEALVDGVFANLKLSDSESGRMLAQGSGRRSKLSCGI